MFGGLGSFWDEHIGGFFRHRFSGELEPADIRKALEQELARRRKHSKHGFIVPNAFEVLLGTEDYQRLSSARLMEDMTVFLEKMLIRTDSFMEGTLSLRLREYPEEKKGFVEVDSRYEDSTPVAAAATESNTLVLSHTEFTRPLNLPPVRLLASLRVVRGIDAKAHLELGERKVYLGRREQNDLMLTDLNVSRLHASVDYERHRHVIRDADSLNGLFINGERKKEACLLPGDEIGLGSTLLRYEVL